MSSQTLNFAAITHTPDSVYAYPVNSNTLCLRLKTAKGDCAGINVRFKNIYDHTSSPSKKRMNLVATDQYNDYYEVKITEPGKRFKYFFDITDHSGFVWNFSFNGFTPYCDSFKEYFFYPYLFEEEVVSSPEWARTGLIYQIFIDRFHNGDKSNDPPQCQDWNSPPNSESFYGGDFKGILDKLEYIASLGVTILYFNPIFLSDTNHKYDTIDYYKIDPAFGTVEEACELVRKAHRLGMRIILDAVFNHCSNKNELFLDVVDKGETSKYYNWFSIEGPKVETCPPNYDSFAGLVPQMPRLNTSNPEVAEYCIHTAIYWTKVLDIDGWRLDVADEVSHVLWREFRHQLRMIKSDLFILGEVWNRATPWLMGDEFDSATNYKFKNALLAFTQDCSRSQTEFWNEASKNEMNYRSTTLPYLVNLVSSHDVKRVLTELNDNEDLVRLVIGIILTYPGIPLLYYGDEIGIKGGEDPDNRRTMKWDEKDQNTTLLSFVRRLGNLRKSTEALTAGTVEQIRDLPLRVLGFTRNAASECFSMPADSKECGRILVLANFSPEDVSFRLNLATDSMKESNLFSSCLDSRLFFADKDNQCEITLSGYDFLVLKQSAMDSADSLNKAENMEKAK